ncbi:MAG TPA: hypothetical protein DD471_13025 [Planctomycetes bacterium]|nr:hypothetical protein [Planctomycetota bacterium]
MFVNPLLLFGLAMVSAPVIIHILNKRRYRVQNWAAMDFLLAAQVSNRRRVKFEDLILLLLRMAIIGFLVMAVARPVLRGLAGWREDSRIVVMDDSFSMEAVSATGKVFDTARESAVSQVQDAMGGSVPVSVWLGSRPESLLGKVEGQVQGGVVTGGSSAGTSAETLASLAGRDLLDSLREVATSDLPLDFPRVLRKLIDEAKGSAAPVVRSVVLVSDYRRRDWLAEDGSLADSLKVLFEEIKREDLVDGFNFQFVDVSAGALDNTAITGFSIESDPVLAGVPVRIAVEVTNYGKEPRVRVEGNVEVGGSDSDEFVARHKIPLPTIESIAPGETVRVEIQHIFTEGGEYPLKAGITPDRLARDDESVLVAVVRDSLQVALVDGAPSANRFASESGLLTAALSPRGDVPSGVSVRLVEGEIDAKELEDADSVFILNRSKLSRAEQAALGAFAGSGGGIAYFLGNKIDVESYLELARPPAEGPAARPVLFPAILKEVAPAAALHLDFGENDHPTLELFRGLKNSSFDHVIFRRFFLLEPLPGATVVASYDDELSTPAVIEGRYSLAGRGALAEGEKESAEDSAGTEGRGRIAVFNTTADRDWGDWPTDYTYPILMQEWVRYLSRSYSRGRVSQAGDALRLEEKPGVSYRIEPPSEDTSSEANPADEVRVGLGESYRPHSAGLFRVVEETAAGDTESATSSWYSVRRAAGESDLAECGEESLRAALAGTGIRFVIGGNVDVDAFRRDQEGEVWRWLALAAGVFLLLELFAAWWFGRKV